MEEEDSPFATGEKSPVGALFPPINHGNYEEDFEDMDNDLEYRTSLSGKPKSSTRKKRTKKSAGKKKILAALKRASNLDDSFILPATNSSAQETPRKTVKMEDDLARDSSSMETIPGTRKPSTPPPNVILAKIESRSSPRAGRIYKSSNSATMLFIDEPKLIAPSSLPHHKASPGLIPGSKALESINAIKLQNYAMRRRQHIAQKIKLLKDMRSFEREGSEEIIHAQKARNREILAAWKIRYYVEYFRFVSARKQSDAVENVNVQLTEQIQNIRQMMQQLRTDIAVQKAAFEESQMMLTDSRNTLSEQGYENNDLSEKLNSSEEELRILRESHLTLVEELQLTQERHANAAVKNNIMENELQITRLTCQEMVRTSAHKDNELARFPVLIASLQQQLSDKDKLLTQLEEVYREERENATMREEDAELKKHKLHKLLDLLQEKDTHITHLTASLQQEQAQLQVEQAFHLDLQAAVDTAKNEITTMQLEKDSLHRVIGDLAKTLQHTEEAFTAHKDHSQAVIAEQQAQLENAQSVIDMLEHEKRQLQFAVTERDEQIAFITEENHYLGTEIECYMMKTEELYEQNRLHTIAANRSTDYSRHLEEELFTARRISANPAHLQPLYLPNMSSTGQSVVSHGGNKRFAGPAVFEEGSVYYAPPHSLPVGNQFGHHDARSDDGNGSVSQSFSHIRPHQTLNEFLVASHQSLPKATGYHSSTASQAGGEQSQQQQQLNGGEHAAMAAYMSTMNLTPTGNSFGMDHKLLTLVTSLEDKMNNMDKATASLKILMEKAESLERQQTNRRSSNVSNTKDGTLRRAAMRKDVKNIRGTYSNNHTDDEASLDGQGSLTSVIVRDIDHPDFVGLKPSEVRALQDEERLQHRLAKKQAEEEKARQEQEAIMLTHRTQFIDEHVHMERAFLELQTNLLSISNELQQQKVDIAQLQEVRNKCKSEVNKWKKSFKKLNFGREPTEEERDSALRDYLQQIDYLRDQISLYKANNLTLNAKAIALQTELYHLNSDLEHSTKEFTKQFNANITDFYPDELTQLMHAPQSPPSNSMIAPGKSFAFDPNDSADGFAAWGVSMSADSPVNARYDSPTAVAANGGAGSGEMLPMMSVIMEGTDESPDAFATSIDILPSVLEAGNEAGEGGYFNGGDGGEGDGWNGNLANDAGDSLVEQGSLVERASHDRSSLDRDQSLERSVDGTNNQGNGGFDENSTIRSGRSRRKDKDRSPRNKDKDKDSTASPSPRRGNKDKKKRRAGSKLKKSASTASSSFDAGNNNEGFNHIDASFAAADGDINPFLLAYGEMHDDHPLQPLVTQEQQSLQLNTSQETLSTLSAGSLLRLQQEGGLSPLPPALEEGGEGEVLGIAEMQAAVDAELEAAQALLDAEQLALEQQQQQQQQPEEEEEDPTMLLAISIAEQVNLHAITHELISQFILSEQTQATHDIQVAYELRLEAQQALQLQQEEYLFSQTEAIIFDSLFTSLYENSTLDIDNWLLEQVLNSTFERVFSRTLREEVDYLEEERKLKKPERKLEGNYEEKERKVEGKNEGKVTNKTRKNNAKNSSNLLQRQENLRLAQSLRAKWSQSKGDLDLILVDLQGNLDTQANLKVDFHESLADIFDFHRQFVDLCGHPAEYMDLTRSKNFNKISAIFTHTQGEYLANLLTAQLTLKQAKTKLAELENTRLEVTQNAVLLTEKIIDLRNEFILPEVSLPVVESSVELDPFALRLVDESRLLPHSHQHEEEEETRSVSPSAQSRPVTTADFASSQDKAAEQSEQEAEQEEKEQTESELVDSLHMSVGLRQALGMTVRSMDEKALSDAAAIWKPPTKSGLDDSSLVIKDMAAYFEDMGISWMNDAVKTKPQPAHSEEAAEGEDSEEGNEEGVDRLRSASNDSTGSPNRLRSRTFSNHSPSFDNNQQPLETVNEEDDHYSLHSLTQAQQEEHHEVHKVRRTSMEFVGDLITTALSTKIAALTAFTPSPIAATEVTLAQQLAQEDADDASLNKLLNHFDLDAESIASNTKRSPSNKQSSSSTDGEAAVAEAPTAAVSSPPPNALSSSGRMGSMDENELLNALVNDLKQLSVMSEMSNSTVSDPKVPFLSQAVNAASHAATKLFTASKGSGKNNASSGNNANGNVSRGPSRRGSITIAAASPSMSGKNSASPSRRGSIAGALSSAVAFAAERATSPLAKSRRGSFFGGGAVSAAAAPAAASVAASRGTSATASRPNLSRGRSRAASNDNTSPTGASVTAPTAAAAASQARASSPSQTETALKAEYLQLKKELRDWKMNFMKENGGRAPAMADFHELDYDMQVKIARKNQLKKTFGETLSSPSKKIKCGKSKKGSGLEADEEDDDDDMT